MKKARYKKYGVKTADSLGDCRRLRQVRQGGTRQQLNRETRREVEDS
jgi:hypothetical protein